MGNLDEIRNVCHCGSYSRVGGAIRDGEQRTLGGFEDPASRRSGRTYVYVDIQHHRLQCRGPAVVATQLSLMTPGSV